MYSGLYISRCISGFGVYLLERTIQNVSGHSNIRFELFNF